MPGRRFLPQKGEESVFLFFCPARRTLHLYVQKGRISYAKPNQKPCLYRHVPGAGGGAAHGLPRGAQRGQRAAAHAYPGAAVRPAVRPGVWACLGRFGPGPFQPDYPNAPRRRASFHDLRAGGVRPSGRAADPADSHQVPGGGHLPLPAGGHAVRARGVRRGERRYFPGGQLFPADLAHRLLCDGPARDCDPDRVHPADCACPADGEAGPCLPLLPS